jgi:hypothetical protein
MASSTETITLNLTDIKDATILNERNQVLNLAILDEFHALIAEFEAKAVKYQNKHRDCFNGISSSPSNEVPERCHRTITISGERGSGKTTFLRTAFDLYKKKKSDENQHPPAFLDILDPTLIEEKDHFFVNIISRIKQHVDSYMQNHGSYNKQDSYDKHDSYDSTHARHKEWLQSLRDLASGLPMLDGIGGNHGPADNQWADPVFVMEKGLREVKAANQLEFYFHRFVHNSLGLLRKSVFILAFDDIDLRFDIGWTVLETIRKYLTSPQIITVIAGDLGLYSMMIRKHQWENFSDKQLKQDDSRKNGRNFHDMVNHLEIQYFLKVLRVEYRFTLENMYEIAKENNIAVLTSRDYSRPSLGIDNAEGKDKPATPTLHKLSWQDLNKHLFSQEWKLSLRDEIDIYERALYSNPLRSIFQILNAYDKNPKKLSQAIADIFLDDLTEMRIPIKELRNPDPRLLLNHITSCLVNAELIQDGYRLKPEFEDSTINNTMLVLGLALTQQINRHPHLFFESLIKLGLTREYDLRFLKYATNATESSSKRNHGHPHSQDYLRYSGIKSGEDIVHIAWMGTGYYRAALGYHSKTQTINQAPLFGTKIIQTDSRDAKSLVVAQNAVKAWPSIFLSLPAGTFTDMQNSSQKHWVFSFPALLAVISECLRFRSSPDNSAKEELARLLRKFSQIRNFPLPTWDSAPKDPSSHGGGHQAEKEIMKDLGDLDKLVDIIHQWINLPGSHGFDLPAHVYMRISTRFFNTLNEIDAECESPKLGVRMHRMVVAFFNSILVEEALHKLDPQKLNLELSNPICKDTIFISNLNNARKTLEDDKNPQKKEINLTNWIMKCPLLFAYLNFNEGHNENAEKAHELINKDVIFYGNSEDAENYRKKIGMFFGYMEASAGETTPSIFDILNDITIKPDPNSTQSTATV